MNRKFLNAIASTVGIDDENEVIRMGGKLKIDLIIDEGTFKDLKQQTAMDDYAKRDKQN